MPKRKPAKTAQTPVAVCRYTPPSPLERGRGDWGGWFHESLTDKDGYFDIGNIGVAVLVVLVLGAIPSIIFMVAWAMAQTPQRTINVAELGGAIGAICLGFATALGALGAYRRLADNPPAPPQPARPQQVSVLEGAKVTT